jgi:hypothetical protein
LTDQGGGFSELSIAHAAFRSLTKKGLFDTLFLQPYRMGDNAKSGGPIMSVRYLAAVGMMAGILMGAGASGARADEYANGLLKKAGAVQYAQKAPYGAGIAEMLLGYDADGNASRGILARTATYRKP